MILLDVLALCLIKELNIDDTLMISMGPWKTNMSGEFEYISRYDDPHVYVHVSDKFYWATADFERIETDRDLELFTKAVEDCQNIDKYCEDRAICIVYAARKRNLQPMPRYMVGIVEELLKDLPENTVWH